MLFRSSWSLKVSLLDADDFVAFRALVNHILQAFDTEWDETAAKTAAEMVTITNICM